jgi:hypothetical protein
MPELTPFGDSIWVVDGPNVRDMGLLFTTRMTVVRLSDGSVWVESPVTLPEGVLEQVGRIGPVRYIVVSTQRHIWRLNAWHDLFPNAQIWAPTKAALTVGDIDVTVEDLFTDTPAQGWAHDFEQLAFKGSSLLREVIFFHKHSQTVIMGDLIQVNPILKGKPFRNIVFRLAGAAYPKGGVSLDIRMSFRNRLLARESLERLLSWDFDKLIIAHGACIETNAKSFVMDAFAWLLR